MDELRKPMGKVMSITQDRLTDYDYQIAVDLQAITLKAQQAERDYLFGLQTRLNAGAVDLGGKYYLDRDLGIVRRRETKTG